MDLLCPACQQKLTIPDDFAGQPAKCPQCGHTFTAPTLPPMPGAYTPPAAPPAPPPAPFVPSPQSAAPPPPSPEPQTAAVPAPAPAAPPVTAVTPVTVPPPAPAPTAPPLAPAPAPEPPPQDYTRRWTIWIGPNFWCWVAVAAALLVVVLSFFPWVGYFPGGMGTHTQSAWQAAFGGESVDKDLAEFIEKKNPLFERPADDKKSPGPGANGLLIVYVLLLIPVLLVTGAVAVWSVLPRELPPAVQQLKPWRWGIVAALALVALLFLVLQMVTGFTLERSLQDRADRAESEMKKDFQEGKEGKQPLAPGSKEGRALRMLRGLLLSPLQRTGALRAASSLHLLLVLSAVIMFWLERRGNKPRPRIDVLS